MATEVFRFVCARPAKKDIRAIGVREFPDFRRFQEGGNLQVGPGVAETGSSSAVATVPNRVYTDKISALDALLGPAPSKLEPGLITELDHTLVRQSIATAFLNEDLAKLIQKDDWQIDEEIVDYYLYNLWRAASDPLATGPQLTRHRQLYDLVRQAAEPSTGREGEEPFVLKGLVLGKSNDEVTRPRGTAGGTTGETTGGTTGGNTGTNTTHIVVEKLSLQTLSADDNDTQLKRIADLNEALSVLNSSAVLQFWKKDAKAQPGQSNFQLASSWTSLLSQQARTTVEAAGIASSQSLTWMSITLCYDTIIQAIKTTKAGIPPPKFKSGLYSVGMFNLEMNKPWSIPTADLTDGPASDGAALPAENPSLIKPTGVGDLLIVRDHVWKYVGGEIGAIQNVLKSELLVRETDRLDRTETTVFSSTETQNEEERDQQTTSRFALNKEANNVIKSDSAMKLGVTTTAYGPTVQVKGDFSVALNNSTETSNKVASQYSQDITSRAASKVIEKTFNSTSQTTISAYQEHYRHEFNNTGDNKYNISGVYQWVNKISQCQMYNYGKRLLIDIVIPEPAAFLITQNKDTGPVLQKPIDLVETALDLNESNYAEIAARYQTSGVKPPGDMLFNFSQSFKAEGGGGTAQSSSINLDIEIPAGYLAYSAKIQVGVRTGPTQTVVGDYGFLGIKTGSHIEYGEPRAPNTFVSVGGEFVKAGTGTVSGTDTKEDTTGVVTFDLPLLGKTISISVAQENYLAMSGTVQICCIRQPWGFASWQQTTYDSILTAYTKQKMDYERSVSEVAISETNVVSGDNPLENTTIISNELKKTCIEFMTAQNFNVFGTVVSAPE
jgi:hypothetical protein